MPAATSGAEQRVEDVPPRLRPRHQRHGAGGEQRHLLALHEAVDGEGERRRRQQHHADHRAHREVLLADHLLVDVGRQHVEIAADHLGDAEVGHHQGEHDQRRADHAVLGAGQGDGEEDADLRGAQHVGRLVEARVGGRERRHQDHHGVRQAVEDLGDDDALEAVDLAAAQPRLEEALGAEQVDQRQAGQQRRREDRDQRDALEQPAQRQHGAGQRIGVEEGERHHDRGADRRDMEAVQRRVEQRRRREIGDVVGQPDELAVAILEALRPAATIAAGRRSAAARPRAAPTPARISRSSRDRRTRSTGVARLTRRTP